MRAVGKLLVIVAGIVVVLAIAAAIAAKIFLDPDKIRAEAVAWVKQETGRDLVMSEDLSISVFPWIGLDLGSVQLGNAPGFGDAVFASTERVSVRVKLVPLLSRRVEADTVVVDGLVVNLARDAKGKTNWSDLTGAGKPGAAPGGKAPAPAGAAGETGPGMALADVAIGGISIENGTITWKDAQAGQDVSVRNVRLSTAELRPGKPVDVEAGFDLEAAGAAAAVKAATTLTLAGDALVLDGLEVDARLSGKSVPGGESELGLAASRVAYDGKAQTLEVKDLSAKGLGLQLTGAVQAAELDKTARLSGQIALAEFAPRSLLEKLGTELQTADGDVLAKASVTAKLSGTPDSIALRELNATLDDTKLTGQAEVRSFAGPVVRFDLALDQIDADRYLPPAGKEEQPGAKKAAGDRKGQAKEGAPAPADFQALRALDLDGQAKIGKLRIAKLQIADIAAKISAKQGLIKLSPVSASLYDGAYKGNLTYDVRKDTPRAMVDEALTGVQLGPLLRDMTGEDRLSGAAEVTAKLSSSAASADAFKRGLGGKVTLRLADGALKGVNLAQMLREAKAVLKGQPRSSAEQERKTDFSEMTATIDFAKGVGTNKDLSAKSPLLRVTGAGTADLVKEELDYGLMVKVVGTAKGQGGADLAELKGIDVPIKVSGSFAEPKYGLDTKVLAREMAKSKGKELLGLEKKAPAEEGASEGGVKGLLKGLIKPQ